MHPATSRIATVKPLVPGDTLDSASMSHLCPGCRRSNILRLSTSAAQRTWRNNLYARYRCRDCNHEFWGIRGKVYVAGATLLGAIVLALIAAYVLDAMFNHTPPMSTGQIDTSQKLVT
jgi:transposase-like protein